MAITILAVTAVLLATLERFERFRLHPQRFWRPYFGSDVVYLMTGYVASASLAIAYVLAASRVLGDLGLPRLAAIELPLWLTIVLALLAIDAGNYLAHWLLHRVKVLWEFHKIHHSSRTLDWLAGFRSHIVEQMVRRLIAPLALIVVGFPALAVVLAAGIFTAWAALNHSNLRFGPAWLEWLLVTPRLHRLHHDPATSERNLGTILTLWDKLRGTLVTTAPADVESLGVPGEVISYPQDWWPQLSQPFRRHSPQPMPQLEYSHRHQPDPAVLQLL